MTRPSPEPGPIFPAAMDPAAAAALSQTAFLGILLVAVLSGYAIRRTRFMWATEGSVALLLGLVAGGVLFAYYYLADPSHRIPRRLVTFDEDVFFQTLLPPIIFSAGFSVKKKLFFRNFFTLMIFGVLGTMVSAGILASGSLRLMTAVGLPLRGLLRTALALGSVLSCTDSVASLSVLDGERHPLLYSLLFGEGVVNDATAIVLLGAVSNLNSADEAEALGLAGLWALSLQFLRLFALSTALGLGVGMASAALVRRLFRRPSGFPSPSPASAPAGSFSAAAAAAAATASSAGSDHSGGGGGSSSNQEVLAVALLGLVAYFLAEALDLSAILSVFFCGIAMSHYTWHSLSPAAKVITRHGFHVISSACEVTLFVYAGLDVWVTAVWWRPDVSRRYLLAAVLLAAGLLLMMMAARAAFTFPVCWAANRLWRRADPIPVGGASVLWWGGLPRGAITLALAYHCFYKDANTKPEELVVISAVILVVVITTVGFGVITQPVMQSFMNQAAKRAGPGAGLTPPPGRSAGPSSAFATPGAAAAGQRAPAFHVNVTAQAHGRSRGTDTDLHVPLLPPPPPPAVPPAAEKAEPSAPAAAADADAPSAPPPYLAGAASSGLVVHAFEGLWQQANDMLWRGEMPGLATGVPVYTPPPPPVLPPPGSVAPHAEICGGSGAAGAGSLAAAAAAATAVAVQRSASGVGTPRAVEGPHSAVLLPQGPRGVVGLGGVRASGLTAEAAAAAEGDEEAGSTWLHGQWRRFDARWLQPLLGGSRTDGAL
ncbi:hypothetical protein HYH02_001719 [Chlamydomonas schloesseri]|uniref:Cation/H+ exchanger transmembrane domain-containing protein n=1 Tax=Chlamydomonas schloesseri TaxID=2026947 RepID=A0A835WU67_9CHLO|nr:hypothetical protein HYH02_001719 [Chlamydomonas schloesseri]|eukprot:KAG2453499.1 hypothetical protein HYH02_001719 [Chlamydomonas schloesseri]